jgi:hypothetical protein
MKINIEDPFSGLSGFSHIPFDIDRKWLKAQMAKTGQSARKCIFDELAKIPAMLEENIRLASEVNKVYRKAFALSEQK